MKSTAKNKKKAKTKRVKNLLGHEIHKSVDGDYILVHGLPISTSMPRDQIEAFINDDPNALGVMKPEDFEPRNTKMRISIMIDSDILNEVKRRAKFETSHGQYQTFINEMLRELMLPDTAQPSTREIAERLAKLEEFMSQQQSKRA